MSPGQWEKLDWTKAPRMRDWTEGTGGRGWRQVARHPVFVVSAGTWETWEGRWPLGWEERDTGVPNQHKYPKGQEHNARGSRAEQEGAG